MSNQQQFRQSEREDAHNAELGKRMDARIATGPKWIPADGTPSPKGLSPNGMPLGENCSQMVFMGGNRFDKINGWAVKQADGSIIESQWKLDAQNKLEYRQTDLLDRNGVRQKTVSYFHDSETQQNTAKVLIFKDGKNVEYTANYTEIAHNKWELTSVFNSKSQPLDDDNKKKFEKDHPNDKMMNTSSLKQAGLDPMDQLPENVRRTAQSLENHHRDKLAEKGLSPEEIQNACVALACNMGQYPGRQPKEILTTYLNQNGEIRVVTQERYAPSVVIETAKTQTFEQSVATMDQALEQQQQAMQQRQNQSQGGPVLSMGGHRMV